MIDEQDKDLPRCNERSINYPMHQFLLSVKDNTLAISLVELGSKRGNGKLPKSAYNHPSWWRYIDKKRSDRTHVLAWWNAGWYVDQLIGVGKKDIPKEDKRVIFKRRT